MAIAKKTTLLKDAFVDYLHECGKRVTPERLAILEVMEALDGVLCIDDLRECMVKQAFPVSTATLYNTVELLVEAGMAKCIRIADSPTAYYRLNSAETPHVYLICSQCGSIKETSAKNLTRFIRQYDFPRFSPQSFTLSIQGICGKCRKLNESISEKKQSTKSIKYNQTNES